MNKDEKQSIYEIYRACRLCGAGAGYKMPIIQSVIDCDGEGTKLQQKIRECIQLEVNLNDKMPPLICELCADKIDDFFEFRAMCHENNRKTRLRLGLPLQEIPEVKAAPDTEDCILGVTEPVYVESDSDEGEPLARQSLMVKTKPRPKSVKMRKEGDVKIKIENYQPVMKEKLRSPSPELLERREMRMKREPSPKRTTRQKKSDEMSLSELEGVQILTKPPLRPRVGPKSVLRREQQILPTETENESEESEDESNSLLVLRSKRPREREIINLEIDEIPPPVKKIRPDPPKPGPKSSKLPQKPTPPQKLPPLPKPGPKSKKREPSPVPILIPHSRKSEISLVPIPKSRKSEPSLVPTPKSRKSEQPPVPIPKSRVKEPSPAPIPKSRKSEPSPVPVTKSRKSETAPGPKSRKSESAPGPKSRKSEIIQHPKKREPSPVPSAAPKSKKTENSSALTSRTKKSDPFPAGPKSKKRERELSPGSPRPSPPPQRNLTCMICGQKAKAAQGLSSHMKIHAPGFTQSRLSCNPCEEWFSSYDEAARHHRRHSSGLQPYTCAKCYDDFRTMQDYDLHFARNQCLPTYEVPDVKCEECWGLFPTYKLLEDHKCPGEGGRPGGKCSKCKRTYTTLKSLTVHEIRCSVKKKGQKVEPVIEADVSRRLLPMEVRISKCDSLLKNTTNNCCDVSGVSHRFGLDESCHYPYLYSMGDISVKTEVSGDTFDHMVTINDEIKQEFLNEDTSYVHWDSDASVDSNNDTETSFDSNKVDTLSTISLKTIFSPKCLGKVPKKKRKVNSEKEFASILSIDFPGDIKKNIDSIIDNLGIETHSDNDSDSILDKNIVLNKRSDILDNLKENTTNNIASDIKTEDAKEVGNGSTVSDNYDSELNKNKTDSFKDKENTNKPITQNCNELDTDRNREKQTDYIEEDVNKVTNASSTEAVETTNTNTIQSKNLKATGNNLNQKSEATEDLDNNNDKFKNDLKNDGHITEQVAGENEPSRIEDKVEITPQTLEKMDVLTEPTFATICNADIDSRLTNIVKKDNEEILPEISEKHTDIMILTDSPSSNAINYKGIEDLNTEKDDSQSSVAIDYEPDENSNSQKTDSQTSDTINHESIENANKDESQYEAISYKRIEDLNTEKNDSQTSDSINYTTKESSDSNIERSNIEKTDSTSICTIDNSTVENNDSQSTDVTIDQSNHADNTKIESNDTVEDSSAPKSKSNEICDKNEATVSNSIDYPNNSATDDEKLKNNVQCIDKFNINDLNDEEKRLMEELDAQIGENQNSNETDANRQENSVTSENKQENSVTSENRQERSVINENRQENSVTNKNRQENYSEKTLENTNSVKQSEFSRNDASLVIGNIGFGDINSEENTLESLIQKQDDLTSLELDSISDEEFNFDI